MNYRLVILLLFSPVFTNAQNAVIDSLEKIVNSSVHDTLKTLAYSDLCWEYRQINQQKAIENGIEGVKLSRKINYKTGEGKTLNDLSIIYIDLGKLDSAIILLSQAKEIRETLGDNLGVAAIHNKLGIIYQNQNELEKALEENFSALEIYEQENIPGNISHIKNNIANIHFRLGSYDKAIEIHEETLALREKLKDSTGVGYSYLNIANVYNELNEPKRAIENYKNAILLFEKLDNDKDLSFALSNIGSEYLEQKEYENAKVNLERALKIRNKIGDQKTICTTEIILGKLYFSQPNPNYIKAEQLLRNALQLNQSIGLKINEKEIYYEMSNLYKITKNVDSAFYYQELYNELLKEEYQNNLKSKVSELQTIYETEKKDKENEKLARINAEEEAKRKSVELKLSNRNKWIIGITFGSISLLFLALLLIQRNKQRAKEELQNKLDIERKKGIKAIFESQEKERTRISKDLHDGVGQQLSGLKMAWSKISTNLNQSNTAEFSELITLTKILDDTATEIRDLSHQMMPKTLQELGLLPALEDTLEKSFKFSNIDYQFDNFGIDNQRFSADIEIGLYRIAQELINNIIKHSQATKVDFQIFKTDKKLQLIVTDNGLGIDEKSIISGHGFSNIKTRLSTISGNLFIESDKGTTIRIIVNL